MGLDAHPQGDGKADNICPESIRQPRPKALLGNDHGRRFVLDHNKHVSSRLMGSRRTYLVHGPCLEDERRWQPSQDVRDPACTPFETLQRTGTRMVPGVGPRTSPRETEHRCRPVHLGAGVGVATTCVRSQQKIHRSSPFKADVCVGVCVAPRSVESRPVGQLLTLGGLSHFLMTPNEWICGAQSLASFTGFH